MHVGKPCLLSLVKYISTLWAVSLFECLHAVFQLKPLSHSAAVVERDAFEGWTNFRSELQKSLSSPKECRSTSGRLAGLTEAMCFIILLARRKKICMIWGLNCPAWLWGKNGQWGPSSYSQGLFGPWTQRKSNWGNRICHHQRSCTHKWVDAYLPSLTSWATQLSGE